MKIENQKIENRKFWFYKEYFLSKEARISLNTPLSGNKSCNWNLQWFTAFTNTSRQSATDNLSGKTPLSKLYSRDSITGIRKTLNTVLRGLVKDAGN